MTDFRKSSHVYIDKGNLSGIIYGCVVGRIGLRVIPWVWLRGTRMYFCCEAAGRNHNKKPITSQIK